MAKRVSSKESHASLFNRYIWLIDVVYSRGRITFEEICDRWSGASINEQGNDFPLRTFHNHRRAIEQMFDINIECDKRGGYQYYIENSEDMERGGVRQWLVNTFAVNNLINESHKLKSQILFEEIPSGQSYLTQVIEAMRDCVALNVTYHSFWKEEKSTYLFEPYCVKVFRQRWYVIGKTERGIRTLSLDRILAMENSDTNYAIPADFDAKEHFYNVFGISNPDVCYVDNVVVKVRNDSGKQRYFATLPLHHSQEIIEQTAEHTTFSWRVKPTYDLRQELLSHGVELEVLAPAWFRNQIADIFKAQAEAYK